MPLVWVLCVLFHCIKYWHNWHYYYYYYSSCLWGLQLSMMNGQDTAADPQDTSDCCEIELPVKKKPRRTKNLAYRRKKNAHNQKSSSSALRESSSSAIDNILNPKKYAAQSILRRHLESPPMPNYKMSSGMPYLTMLACNPCLMRPTGSLQHPRPRG